MKKRLIPVMFILLLLGCSKVNTKTQMAITTEQIDACDLITFSTIKDIKNMADGNSVTLCGVISAWDYESNFFIQDEHDGIYIYSGRLNVNIKHQDVGKTVKIVGVKDTYLETHQIRLEQIEILNEEYNRPKPIELFDFSNLLDYEGKLITLMNVNIGDTNNTVTNIYDGQGNIITRIYYGSPFDKRNQVDITGIIYNRTNRGVSMAISSQDDVVYTKNLLDEERMSIAYKQLNLKETMTVGQKLPTFINGVEIEWSSNNTNVEIVKGLISTFDSSEYIDVNLTAYIFYKEFEPLKKVFNIRIINKEVYQFPKDYHYDGPTFPHESVNKEFWNVQGGLIAVTFNSCHDGDTAKFVVGELIYTTRFLGIDTEELYHPVVGAEEWGKPASIYTCDILKNAGEIVLQSDPGNREFDDYERLLAWIWVDGELLQYRLVSLGLAEVFYVDHNRYYTDSLRLAQKNATQEKQGKWGKYLDPYWDYKNNRLTN